jgi:hypothetical protein
MSTYSLPLFLMNGCPLFTLLLLYNYTSISIYIYISIYMYILYI